MAVAKKAKAAPSKSKPAKASTNKKASAKPAAKPAGYKAVTKKSPAKKAAPAKVVKTTPAKPASKSAPAPSKAKTVSKAAPAKPVVKTVPVKQIAKPVEKPTAAKKEAPKKDTKAVPPVSKKTAAAASAFEKKSVTPAKTPASKAAPTSPASKVKSEAVKTVPAKPATAKSSGKQPEKKLIAPKPSDEFPDMDPADAKAKKIMRELEETMDLAKMKPRIKVPTPTKTITRHVNHPPLKLVEPTHTNKQKFSLEFEFRSSPKILFNALSDSSGLAGWFADEVRTKDDQFTFVWEGGESYARLVAIKDMFLVRFQWAEDTDGTYFQFEIKQDELTGEIALVITDFALPGERETNIRLWESQVQNLRMLLGSL